MINAKLGRLIALPLFVIAIQLAASQSYAANEVVVATATSVRGTVTATEIDGDIRIINKDSELYEGDRIDTGDDSAVRLRFTDNSVFSLSQKTTFYIEDYTFSEDQQVASNSAAFKLFNGALEALSGLIGKGTNDKFRLDTPISTIGIRGTRYTVEVIREPGQPIQVRVFTLEGAIIYSTYAGDVDGKSKPLPENVDTATVETDEEGKIEAIIVSAGNELTATEEGVIQTAITTAVQAQNNDPEDPEDPAEDPEDPETCATTGTCPPPGPDSANSEVK